MCTSMGQSRSKCSITPLSFQSFVLKVFVMIVLGIMNIYIKSEKLWPWVIFLSMTQNMLPQNAGTHLFICLLMCSIVSIVLHVCLMVCLYKAYLNFMFCVYICFILLCLFACLPVYLLLNPYLTKGGWLPPPNIFFMTL